ncbi:hypothetical protein GCM10007086_00530 [Photobacterium aphoticum]|nr:hypothetical protein GCM10007086_00530 [Photobacterium aphoticum]
MRTHIDTKVFRRNHKVIKVDGLYYLYTKKFFLFWVSDGVGYNSKKEATISIPYRRC